MTGVEILTSAQVAAEWAFSWTAFWIISGLAFGICLIAGIWYTITDQCDWVIIPALSVTGIIFGSMFGAGVGKVCEIPVAYETQYKVTISDEVSMTEFLERYEVIDQDGKIFTVKEKTNEEH
jgi:hypothetical protein